MGIESYKRRLSVINKLIGDIEDELEFVTTSGMDPDSEEMVNKRLSIYRERKAALEFLIDKESPKKKKTKKAKVKEEKEDGESWRYNK